MSNCLVIIDVQKGFMLNANTLEIPKKIVALLQKKSFDHIVCTQFYNEDGSPFDILMGWKDLKDSASQALAPEIEAISEKVFRKRLYSCFIPEFEEFIRDNAIDKLYFVGIDTDCCVLQSCTDCFERNIPFEVLINYCASSGGQYSHNAGIAVMERTIGKNMINHDI